MVGGVMDLALLTIIICGVILLVAAGVLTLALFE